MDSKQYEHPRQSQQDIWRARHMEPACLNWRNNHQCTLVETHPAHVKHEDANGGQW